MSRQASESLKPAYTMISLVILGYQKLSTNMKPWYKSVQTILSWTLGISLDKSHAKLSRDIPSVFV